ncbi:MAG: hypothetical protein K2G69_07205 [Muribaculaceae bacterium]|nr:hypothetical protein [Muribaculaceae bacterium]MDE5976319.1 hypothetical protein [Muribaculaceae bacterium]
MKKKNSLSEFHQERRDFLLRNFREAIARQSEIDRNKAFHIVASAPAPRFWVSESRAAAVIGKILAGSDPTESMVAEKREMFMEIFRRFSRRRSLDGEATISDIIFDVVNEAAPRSYLSWQTIRSLIYEEMRIRRKRLERKHAQ